MLMTSDFLYYNPVSKLVLVLVPLWEPDWATYNTELEPPLLILH